MASSKYCGRYSVDDFIGINNQEVTVEEAVELKVNLLVDFTILPSSSCKLANKVRDILSKYSKEEYMSSAIRSLLYGDIELKDWLSGPHYYR